MVSAESLSLCEVEHLLASRIDSRTAVWLAPVHHAASGGNLLLLEALVDDLEVAIANGAEPLRVGEGIVGSRYRQAVVAHLDLLHASCVATARAVATLGDAVSRHILADTVGRPTREVDADLAALARRGLLDGMMFRHSAGQRAVLDATDARERQRWHGCCAKALYAAGVRPELVAEHVAAADEVDAVWGVRVLRLAADADLERGHVERGTRWLELAARWCVEDHEWGEVLLMLLRTEWQRNPASAIRYLGPLRAAMLESRLVDEQVRRLEPFMLWYGYSDEVPRPGGGAPQTGSAFGCQRRLRADSTTISLPSQVALLQAGASADAVSLNAEGALAALVPGCRAVEALIVPLLSLAWSGHPDRAAQWCDAISVEEGVKLTPTGRAVAELIRAVTALRSGHPRSAAECSARAELALTPQAWGPAVVVPRSIRVLAATAMGDHSEAESLLRRAVPDTVRSTYFGLAFHHAHGRHHLAVGQPRLALADFRRCGVLASSWQLDLPAITSWRLGIAEALLALGRIDAARTVIDAHLALPSATWSAVRGPALRLLAAATPSRRVSILREAVWLLDEAGHPEELARALGELGRALEENGDRDEADAIGAQFAPQAPAPPTSVSGDHRAPSPVATTTVNALTDGERRVATLAALGHSNRDIGRALFITVSTVEQHLTRVYRKLRVKSRSQLSFSLWIARPASCTDYTGCSSG